jgi:hypothetical protein
MIITVATLLWEPNEASANFSTCYNEGWVEKLYRGFARNLSAPFRFVCFTDRPREFGEPINQEPILASVPDYSTCIEPYRLNVPMILCGLDTVIVGPCDDLAAYCLHGDVIAVPRDPYNARRVCNGVALVPGGLAAQMWHRFDGRNDMDWIRANPHIAIDDAWPGRVVSYKVSAKKRGIDGASIVYFHGPQKPYEIDAEWIALHWR